MLVRFLMGTRLWHMLCKTPCMLTCFIHYWEYYYAISVKFCRKVHAEWHSLCLLDYKKKKKKKDNELERIWQLLYRKQKTKPKEGKQKVSVKPLFLQSNNVYPCLWVRNLIFVPNWTECILDGTFYARGRKCVMFLSC